MRLVAVALLAFAAAAGFMLRLAPERWIEREYAAAIYPLVTRAIVPLSSRAPLPLGLALAAALLLALPLAAAVAARRPAARPGLWLLLSAAPLLALAWFNLGWGINYARAPVERTLGLPQRFPPEAVGAEAELRELLSLLAVRVTADADAEADPAAAVAAIAKATAQLAVELGLGRMVLPERVRTLPPGTLLTFGFAGVVWPLSLEAHVDGGLPPAAFTAAAAHELAHLAGFAREADAELIGVIAGLRADQPFARYAVALGQWSRAAVRLDDAERAAALANLPERAREDLTAIRSAGERYRRGAAARLVAAVYDRFLRSQGVEAGLADYDRGVDLLLLAWRGGWITYRKGVE